MKRILLVFVLFAAVTALSFGKVIVSGNSNTAFGMYTIELCDQLKVFAGEEMNCYLISYSNSPVQAKVFVDKDKKCRNYVVISDELSVMYTCNGKYFGVNKVGKEYKDEGIFTDNSKLDREDYFHQRVIQQGDTEEYDATMLIASYFPELIKK
jgi:hypothetical protein